MSNEAQATPESVGFFDFLYGKGKEVIDAANKPIQKRRLGRKFKAAYDDSVKIAEDAKHKLHKEFERLADADISTMVNLQLEIDRANDVQAAVKIIYKKMFNKDLVIADDDF